MVHIALFLSVLGLRRAELLAAERLRRAGHEVVAPDPSSTEVLRQD
ncbi:hypothetical protein [Streptomyces sp. NPDC050564]